MFGPLVGALDEGTSSARFILFKAGTATVVVSHQEELPQIHPQEGWVEQDPLLILKVANTCIEKAIEKLLEIGGSVSDVVTIGITNQRETTIVWDKVTGLPLYNAILWLDMRTATTVNHLLDTVPNATRNKDYLKPLCGLPMSPYFSAVKMRWLLDNVPKVKKAVTDGRCLFGTVDSWLIWNLTGGKDGGIHITDVTNASRTMLMNLDTLKWDPVLLKFFELPSSVLATIRSSSEVYGHIAVGCLKNVSISGCLGDQQSALVGQQCLKSGEAKSTYGTGCFLLYNTGTRRVNSSHGLLTTIAYQLGPKEKPVYALEGSVAIAGAAISWLKDNLSVLSSSNQAEVVALEAGDSKGGNVYFVPAFSGLYAPYWKKNARGVIVGVTEDTSSSHLVKATLEAVCYQNRDIIEAMNKDCGATIAKLKVDGGMTSSSLLMQMQSDLTGIIIEKPEMAESTSLGVAMMAGAAVGLWKINRTMEMPVATWKPLINDDERDVKYARWKMAVERSIGWEI